MNDAASVPTARRPIRAGTLAAVFAFAIAMGWLEAVVVVYIRALLGIARGALPPDPAALYERLRSLPWLVSTEQTREIATMIMLATLAWAAGLSFRSRLGTFLISFGTWDIAYYIALYALVRWPPGLGTMDLLFLVPPHPWWYQPVWVPMAVSCGMVAGGLRLARR